MTPPKPLIDKAAIQERLYKISNLFAGMVQHADEQALYRCPYRNRHDECTAKFGCRNQQKPRSVNGLLNCGGDHNITYTNVWDDPAYTGDEGSAPDLVTKKELRTDPGVPGHGTISHGGETRPLLAGKTVFDFADELAVQVPTSCGRTGHCHECIVEIKQGMEALSPLSETESFLRENYRLACQARIEDSRAAITFTPLCRQPKILTTTEEKAITPDPAVTRYGDQIFYAGKAIDKYRGHLYGLAIDLGTTTVVIDLVDLETGDSVCVSSFENPQRFGGSDIMNRISYDAECTGELQGAIVKAINHEVRELGKRHEFSHREVYEIVVAGNSTMRDILFELDVQSIGQRPYKSVVEHAFRAGERKSTALLDLARRHGLIVNREARLYGIPLIASHVGADTAADLVAIDMASQDEVVMLVDIGTNTEVVVGHAGRMVAASCPAGPAFEGGLVKYGMPGYEGAIESACWRDGKMEYSTIGGQPAEGICGSGLIDLLAGLRREGLMEPKGRFADRSSEMLLVPDRGITFSREDASNLAQAKAANYCGQLIVLRHFGINPGDVSKLYLAGGFANYVDVSNAIEIGFLAPIPEERIVKIGNAAVQGAREILLSVQKRESTDELVKEIEHVELETTSDFFENFVEGCQFKPMPTVFYPAIDEKPE
jgi:uncharacterized 2Fe-2S/4Fe-4S cluster protein (DUF4445 family)